MAELNRGKGVIFDMDGVLVDTGAYHLQAWWDLAAREGWPMSEEFFYETFGMQNRQILPMMTDQPLSAAEMEELSQWKEQRYRELIAGQIRLIEGVGELIEELAAKGFLLAVGSSAPAENIAMLLETTGIGGKFSGRVSAEDVSRSKPAPDTFLLAAERLGLPAGRCVVVEDAVHGVEAAKAAGMAVVAVTNTKAREELRGADRVVDSLAELGAEDFEGLLGEVVGRKA